MALLLTILETVVLALVRHVFSDLAFSLLYCEKIIVLLGPSRYCIAITDLRRFRYSVTPVFLCVRVNFGIVLSFFYCLMVVIAKPLLGAFLFIL